MTLRRTDSFTYNDRPQEEVSRSQIYPEPPERPAVSQNPSQNGQHLRIPALLQTILRSQREGEVGKKSGKQGSSGKMKGSQFGASMRQKIKNIQNSIRNTIECQICGGEIKKPKNKSLEVYICECQHKFDFCQSCLHHYAIYKINNFEQVGCPNEGCPATMDPKGAFCKSLPAKIQKNYKKIYKFYLTSKDPNVRLCPKQKCQGLMRRVQDQIFHCQQCKKDFCGKCSLQAHKGDCDNTQLKFFENNLHYRQCKKCKFIIQKNQGCNHITCRCKYQFCYVCGQKWQPKHYGQHDQNGQLIQGGGNRAAAPVYNQPCCDCTCIEDTCGGVMATILKLPIQLILFILLLLVILVVIVGRDLQVIAMMLVTTVLAGITGFTCQIIAEQDGILCLLAVLFLPVTMLLGIGRGFAEVFWEPVSALCQETCQMFTGGVNQICSM